MRTLHLSNDELYQMVKLYDLLMDTDMIDELPIEVENVFDRLQSMESSYDAEDVEECIIETNGDYSECVDRMVESMEKG